MKFLWFVLYLLLWVLPGCGSEPRGDDDTTSNDDDVADDDDTASNDDDVADDDDFADSPCWFEATLSSESGSHSWSGACGTGTSSGIHFMVQPGSTEPHTVSRLSISPSEHLDPYCSFRLTVNNCAEASGSFGAATDELSAGFVRVRVETEGCSLPLGKSRVSSTTSSVSSILKGLTPTEVDRSENPNSISSSGMLSFDATSSSTTNEDWTISGVVSWSSTHTTVGELAVDCP
jgi:hypothetical protein